MVLDKILLPLRIVQGLFALLVLALSAYSASWWSDNTLGNISPSEINFLIFTSVFTLVIVIPAIMLIPRFLPTVPKFAILGVEAVTMIFWFAGFIALAAGVAAFSWCNGSVCSTMKAAAAFGAFEWLAFAGSTVITTLGVVRGKNTAEAPQPGV